MSDLDLIEAKNKLEISIYEIENKYREVSMPPKTVSTLNGLILALRVLMQQDSYIEILKSEIFSIKLQNIKAYKETALLKQRVKKIL